MKLFSRDTRKSLLVVTLTAEEKEALQIMAARNGVTMTAIVLQALSEYADRDNARHNKPLTDTSTLNNAHAPQVRRKRNTGTLA